MAYEFKLWEKLMKEWFVSVIKHQQDNPKKNWLDELKKKKSNLLPPTPPKYKK